MRALKKKPIQIYIEPKQELLIESLAREKGTSKAEIIRLSLDSYLGNLPLEEDPALGIIGMGKSGKKNTSDQHDVYIALYTSDHAKAGQGHLDNLSPRRKKK